jgi:entericidin B
MFLVTKNGEPKMIKRFAVVLGLLSAFFLSACNTMKGAGQDIQSGGEKLENKAEEVQKR